MLAPLQSFGTFGAPLAPVAQALTMYALLSAGRWSSS